MAGIFEVKDLEARKRALVAESEIYRQTLKLEVQNVRLYAVGFKRQYAMFRTLQPLLMLGLPFAGSLFGRRSRRLGLFRKALIGWKIFKQLSPWISRLFAKSAARRRNNGGTPAEEREPSSVI